MRPYGALHISIVIATLLVTVWLSLLCRRHRLPHRPVRYWLAGALAVQEIFRYFYVGYRFPDDLPIHLCTLTTWMAVLSCLTLWTPAVEFVYFTGIVGAGMALLTPDLPKDVQSYWLSYPAMRYFLEHACIIIAVGVLIFGRMTSLRAGAVWRTNFQVFLYAVMLGIFNWTYGTNYMFLCAKPKNPSLLDYMGPWPYYFVSSEILCLLLFWLLWLPVRPTATAPRVAIQSAYAVATGEAEAIQQ